MTHPIKIDAETVFDDYALCSTLGLRAAAVKAASKSGRLRGVRCGRKTLYCGANVLAWIAGDGPHGMREADATVATC